jgi:hypothetical protein
MAKDWRAPITLYL